MKIYVDSREKPQAITRILDYFDKNGIEWEKKKLEIGDYMVDGHPEIIVDRKQSLQELATNLCSQDKARFYREVRKSYEAGVRLIILCEHGGEIKTFNDIRKWKNPHGKVSGKTLQDCVFQLEMSYHVPVLFCDKRSTGKRIIEILTEGNHGQGIFGQADGSVRI